MKPLSPLGLACDHFGRVSQTQTRVPRTGKTLEHLNAPVLVIFITPSCLPIGTPMQHIIPGMKSPVCVLDVANMGRRGLRHCIGGRARCQRGLFGPARMVAPGRGIQIRPEVASGSPQTCTTALPAPRPEPSSLGSSRELGPGRTTPSLLQDCEVINRMNARHAQVPPIQPGGKRGNRGYKNYHMGIRGLKLIKVYF